MYFSPGFGIGLLTKREKVMSGYNWQVCVCVCVNSGFSLGVVTVRFGCVA